VLLIDHQPRRAAGLRGVMREAFWQVHMRAACTLSGGVQEAREAGRLDLIVLELELPEWGGIDALLHVRRELPWLRVLAVVSAEKPNLASAALEAGAVGCISRTLSLFATAAAIRFLAEAGGFYVPSYDHLRRGRPRVAPGAACDQVITPPPRHTSAS